MWFLGVCPFYKFFFFNDTATTEIYTLSLHDALPIWALGPAAGAHLHELSWGRDPRRVVPDEPEKSTGHEETFGTDVDDPAVIHRELLRLGGPTAGRPRPGGRLARPGHRRASRRESVSIS